MMLTGQGGGGGYGMLEDGDGYDDYEDDDEEDGAGEEDDASDYEEEGDGEAIDEDDEVGDAEGAEDDLDLDLDPARFVDDEAYARALQDAKARDVTGRLMALAGFGDCEYTQRISKLLVCPILVSSPHLNISLFVDNRSLFTRASNATG